MWAHSILQYDSDPRVSILWIFWLIFLPISPFGTQPMRASCFEGRKGWVAIRTVERRGNTTKRGRKADDGELEIIDDADLKRDEAMVKRGTRMGVGRGMKVVGKQVAGNGRRHIFD